MNDRKQFPAWRYASGGQSKLCPTQEAVDALGPGWYDSPARVPPPVDKSPTPRRRIRTPSVPRSLICRRQKNLFRRLWRFPKDVVSMA